MGGTDNETRHNCIFCKISAREIPSNFVHETESAFAIRDINPQAPTHILVIPKEHIANIIEANQKEVVGSLFAFAGEIATREKLSDGFRLVVNTGNDGGQTVHHLHIHVLGGRPLGWPPG